MNSLEVKKLTKQYKDIVAVNGISFDIKENELFSLLGINGAGKTTTIKMLSGLIKPTSGSFKILVDDVNNVNQYINVSPQETAIAPNLSVIENLMFIAGIYQLKDIDKKVNNVIKRFSLERVKNKKACKLSGGWQRRLSIAMAVITEPKILFLDEPTLGLDVLARRELWNIIEELKKNTTIILTTHYMEEAEMLSDRIAIMKDGNIIDIDTPNELIKKSNAKSFEDAFVKIVTGGI